MIGFVTPPLQDRIHLPKTSRKITKTCENGVSARSASKRSICSMFLILPGCLLLWDLFCPQGGACETNEKSRNETEKHKLFIRGVYPYAGHKKNKSLTCWSVGQSNVRSLSDPTCFRFSFQNGAQIVENQQGRLPRGS